MTASARSVFFLGDLESFPQDLVLQGLLPQHALELPDALLQRPNLSATDHGIVHPNRFLPTFGHTASPPEEQARRNTMTAGYVGNRHPGLGGFGQYCQLLIQRVTPPTLDAGKNFDSINIRHSRMTRLTPSPSLCSYVRFKWGPFQAHRNPPGPRRPRPGDDPGNRPHGMELPT